MCLVIQEFWLLVSVVTLSLISCPVSVDQSTLLDGVSFKVSLSHNGQCKRTGGCYNELVVAFYSTGGGVKGQKIYTC